ncbi:hypothetical protein [Evansella halocellulosilytica]|uniref:hypothetical protein n=1 Tax=Evansella halocellulosilytica TaxID=2011013 RepID=UPI000BB97876|nr:hypothetical protein [Evansella halocellulosilytica]
MAEYQQFLNERDKIDHLIEQGYSIKSVIENLSGAFVEFELNKNGENQTETLHILNADARKYFSTLMIKQNS